MSNVEWDEVSRDPMRESLIRKLKDEVNWDLISRFQKLSEDFILEFKDKVNWQNISAYQKLSENFISENAGLLDFDIISSKQRLSERFILMHDDKVYWPAISQFQTLSDRFILENFQKLDISLVSEYQIYMSTDTIEKLDKVTRIDWNKIYSYQKKLNYDFVVKHLEKITDCAVMAEVELPPEDKSRYFQRIVLWYLKKLCSIKS